MMRPDHRSQENLATFSIVIAQAKNDPEIRDAILADGSFRTIWPMIASDHDKADPVEDTGTMNDISREELDAKLSAVEARMDRRISDFGADMRQVVADFRVEMAPMKNIKTSIWSAAGFIVASMIAVIGLTVTGFYTGRDTSNLINEAKLQTQETRNLLEQIKAQQLAPRAEKEAPSSPQE